jgi:hypothetical protein
VAGIDPGRVAIHAEDPRLQVVHQRAEPLRVTGWNVTGSRALLFPGGPGNTEKAAETEASRAVRGLHPDALAGLAGDRGRDRWHQLSVAQQRAVLETLFDAVTILTTRQGPGFDPESVHLEWRKP